MKSSRFPSGPIKTSGSSSEVKAGEKLPVRELLYGMMLPSGNDAAVAFAEHFGDRLADEKDKEAHRDAYDSFVSAMNRKAAELGMTSTHYNNTHGLPSAGHVTTARDLARWRMPRFRSPISARSLERRSMATHSIRSPATNATSSGATRTNCCGPKATTV